MFKELLKTKTPITDTLYLRYDIQAFINAEIKGINPFKLRIPIPIEYFRVGLSCCFNEIGLKAPEQAEVISEVIEKLPSDYIQQKILEATSAAFPPPIIGAKSDDKEADFRNLRSLFVDIMRRSEEEFLTSTPAEITERWNNYAVFKGYKKPVETFKQFDD